MATAEEAEAAAERAATRLTLLQAENPTVACLKIYAVYADLRAAE